MAVHGGSHKGNSSNGNRGRPYGLMLLLAFGAALLGVMVIHKLRERRIFNLLVKEKDHQLISLQHLLQKEKEHTKEMKRKAEEIKAKIYSLQTQKMELDRRLLEMQSTIGSLKDEHKIMESALEEKQNEIKTLREANIDPEKEHLQIVALTESLKQKRAEIEDLKHRLEYPVKKWSITANDPSSPTINFTVTTNAAEKEKIQITESKEASELLQEPTIYNNAVNLTRGNGSDGRPTNLGKGDKTASVEDGSENREGITDNREAFSEEHLQTLEKSHEGFRNGGATGNRDKDDDRDNKNGNSQHEGSLGTGDGNNIVNATEAIVNTGGEVSNTGDADGHKVIRVGQTGINHQVTIKGGVKLEMADNSKSAGSKGMQNSVHDARAKGKRWRMLARNRLLDSNRNQENDEAESNRNRKFSSNAQDVLIGTELARKTMYSSHAKLLEPQKDNEDIQNKLGREGTHNRKTKGHTKLKSARISQNRDVFTNGSLDDNANNIRNNAMSKSINERQQSDIEESRSSRDISNKKNNAEEEKVAIKHEWLEELDVEDVEHETDTAAGDFYRDSVPDAVEDKEEYKKETNESEF